MCLRQTYRIDSDSSHQRLSVPRRVVVEPLFFTLLLRLASCFIGIAETLTVSNSFDMAPQDVNLQEIHDCLVEIAMKAGDMITDTTPVVGGAGSKINCKP